MSIGICISYVKNAMRAALRYVVVAWEERTFWGYG